jgi:hypothetical protein
MRSLALAAAALFSATPPDAVTVRPVDPITVQDDDFARHRDPAEWKGLAVTSHEFREERAPWRLWRIVNVKHPKGPLFFVPHDNENAGFEAGLAAVKKYGGVLIAVDSGVSPGNDGVRMNRAVDYGRPIDPNRNFDTALPGYAHNILADLASGAWPIIALHTNAKGFDTGDSRCNQGDPQGSGVISIRFCDDTLNPSPSVTKAYPFDDDDTVAFATFLSRKVLAQMAERRGARDQQQVRRVLEQPGERDLHRRRVQPLRHLGQRARLDGEKPPSGKNGT